MRGHSVRVFDRAPPFDCADALVVSPQSASGSGGEDGEEDEEEDEEEEDAEEDAAHLQPAVSKAMGERSAAAAPSHRRTRSAASSPQFPAASSAAASVAAVGPAQAHTPPPLRLTFVTDDLRHPQTVTISEPPAPASTAPAASATGSNDSESSSAPASASAAAAAPTRTRTSNSLIEAVRGCALVFHCAALTTPNARTADCYDVNVR